jgi:hypothetical protein
MAEVTMAGINTKQQAKRAIRMQEKTLALRNQLWPSLDLDTLWDRKKKKGFTTIPRTLPLMHRIMDDLAPKGKPVSSTYFTLWSRVFDECFLTISNPREAAFESGFSGQRSESTWSARMKILCELGFIEAKAGSLGTYNHILLINPYIIIKELHSKGKIQEESYIALFTRAQDVGARDLVD